MRTMTKLEIHRRKQTILSMWRRKTPHNEIAAHLGISRQALWQFIRRHELDGRESDKLYFIRRGS